MELYEPIPRNTVLCCEDQTGDFMIPVQTAYGVRLTCSAHRRVWTRVVGEGHWVEEKYSGPGQMTAIQARDLLTGTLEFSNGDGTKTVLSPETGMTVEPENQA